MIQVSYHNKYLDDDQFGLYLNLKAYLMESDRLPTYNILQQLPKDVTTYWIVGQEVSVIPENLRETFKKDEEVTHTEGDVKTIFLTLKKAKGTTISSNCSLRVDADLGDTEYHNYLGYVSQFLASAYKFDRKSKPSTPLVINILEASPKIHRAVNLAIAKNRAREWANGRGDVEGVPKYFKGLAEAFCKENNIELTTFTGEELLKEGFRLMHAVGRSSVNEPVFINMAYKGNPDSNTWISFVGKGVCFDTGGYNLKPTSSIKNMFLDKHGACSVFSAFCTVVLEKLPVNLTCSMGFVQNFVSHTAYRPMDIITSRKGLTVEIGNTDAEGRLVLCDCMNWVQEKFKPKVLIELSTLTGAMIYALGSEVAGIFTNDKQLSKTLRKVGSQVNEGCWEMPCTDYHKKLVTPKHCDLTNSPGSADAGASQAAAFLKCFVEEGVEWCHMDIAGTAINGNDGTGYGARLLVQYIHTVACPILPSTQ